VQKQGGAWEMKLPSLSQIWGWVPYQRPWFYSLFFSSVAFIIVTV
jgi:hypothetical protein